MNPSLSFLLFTCLYSSLFLLFFHYFSAFFPLFSHYFIIFSFIFPLSHHFPVWDQPTPLSSPILHCPISSLCFFHSCTNQSEVALVVAQQSSNGQTFLQIKTERYCLLYIIYIVVSDNSFKALSWPFNQRTHRTMAEEQGCSLV